MSDPQGALVWCPFPDAGTAREAAGALLQAKLIACANILPQVESVFEWEGERSSAAECAVLFKTTAQRLASVVDPELLEEDEEYEMTIEDREGPLLANLPGIAVNQ